MTYLWNVLLALDHLANTLLGGNPGETISGRLARRRFRCTFCSMACRVLDWLDPNHCQDILEKERRR